MTDLQDDRSLVQNLLRLGVDLWVVDWGNPTRADRYLQLEDFDRREVMRSCAHALAPGGILLVIGHDSRNLAEGYGGPQDPSVLFTARDIEQDLQDHIRSGTLVVERSDRVAREVETDEGTRVAWDALFRARGRKMSETFQFG